MNAAMPAPAASDAMATLRIEFKDGTGKILDTKDFRIPRDMSPKLVKMYLAEALSKRLKDVDPLIKALGFE